MARTKLTNQFPLRDSTKANITMAAADSTNHHSFDNTSGKVVLVCSNSAGTAAAVRVQRSKTIDGVALTYLEFSVNANTGLTVLGPFDPDIYNKADSGNSLTHAVLVDIPAAAAGLKLAAVTIGV